MDYSSMILSRLTAKRYNKLKVIQNTALRLIFKQKYNTPTATLHQISNIQTIEERFHDLNSKYLRRCVLMENPIITNLFEDYKHYKNGRNVEIMTTLCHYDIYLKNFLNKNYYYLFISL